MTGRVEFGYNSGMKTAVSLPDPVFEAAEKLAKRLKLSRSALYARALEEFVQKSESDDITARINRSLAGVKQERDPFLDAAAQAMLQRSEWDE